ncbi:hypothetical protein WMC41_23725 (plasmid) [Shinella yambaruensis]|uniref:hypothetical protein n=1 Tax=Shinella yambaruensis TaxID=415996 RepID=UPI003D79883A
METINFTPLGFSDLTSDEAFVVSVFRHWQSCGSTCKEAEGSLTEMLKNDRLHEGLLSLFDLLERFRTRIGGEQKTTVPF